MLNKFEALLLSTATSTSISMSKYKNSDYFSLMAEHRKHLELFANLKFAEEKKGKTKVLDEFRRTLSTEDSGE